MTFQFLWSIIQGTLTERTRKKTHIISGSPEVWKPALLESIDPDNLPSQYGGAINTCFDVSLEQSKGIDDFSGTQIPHFLRSSTS